MIHIINTKVFTWCCFIGIDINCWKELFYVYVSGNDQKRFSGQISIFAIEGIKKCMGIKREAWNWSIGSGIDRLW
jgi:hypothetical protein